MLGKPLTATERQGIRAWVRQDPHWPEQQTLVLLDRYEATLAAAEQARVMVEETLADTAVILQEERDRAEDAEQARDRARADAEHWRGIARATREHWQQRATRLAALEAAVRKLVYGGQPVLFGVQAIHDALAALDGGAAEGSDGVVPEQRA